MIPAPRQVPVGAGRTLAVREAGAGLPVVLLHGFPLDHSMWRGQWGLVAPGGPLEGRARLVVPDLAGFGGSPGPARPTIAAMADDVAALLDGLGIGAPAVVCGLSMGGYVTQHLAARHRRRLAGLVLVDTKLEADGDEARRARYDLADRVSRVGSRIAAEAMVPRLVARGPDAALDGAARGRADVEDLLRATIEATGTDTIRTALHALAERPDMTAAAAAFDLPALLVVGAEDTITPPECLERARDTIPGAVLRIVPRCGHMTPLEDPPAFNAELAAFVESLFSSPRPGRPPIP